MATLTFANIESELSYAYLHAIAGNAGMSCKCGDRHDDNHGIDAEVQYRGDIGHEYIKHVQLNIQLKATYAATGSDQNYISYFLQGIDRYNRLRKKDSLNYTVLVVLFLPRDKNQWLNCSINDLIIRNAAYWVCLYGAPDSKNTSGETIYLPRKNLLTSSSIEQLAKDAGNDRIPKYTKP